MDYFTSIPTAVAGAEVTINTGSGLLMTTTDANGNYSLYDNPPVVVRLPIQLG
jgi:hypothetical protein